MSESSSNASPSTPSQGMSCLVPESGKTKCTVNRLITMANRMKYGPALVLDNALELTLDINDIKAMAYWLYSTVSISDSSCKEASSNILTFVEHHKSKIKTIALQDNQGSDAVAELLTECMRVVNFATHKASNIKFFYALIRECGIDFESDEDANKCLQAESFTQLGYVVSLRKVRASM